MTAAIVVFVSIPTWANASCLPLKIDIPSSGTSLPFCSASLEIGSQDALRSTDLLGERSRLQGAVCLDVTVDNSTLLTDWVLHFPTVPLERMEVQWLHQDGSELHQAIFTQHGGQRFFPTLVPSLPVKLQPDSVTRMRIKMDPGLPPQVDISALRLSTRTYFARTALQSDLLILLSLGVLLALALSALVLWTRIREGVFFWYAAMSLSTFLIWATYFDVFQVALGWHWIDLKVHLGTCYLGLFCGIALTTNLLQTHWTAPKLHRLFCVLQGVILIAIPLLIFLSDSTSLLLCATLTLLMFVSMATALVRAWKKRFRAARLFAIAWSLSIVFAVLVVSDLFGWTLIAGHIACKCLLVSQAFALLVMVKSINYEIDALRSEKRRAEARAFTDALTGIGNRGALEAKLGRMSAEHQAGRLTRLTVIFVDLDGMKSINDSYGHDRGDRLLSLVAHHLGHVFRSTDSIYRLGGDEFVVLLPQATAEVLEQLDERLVAVCQELHRAGFDGVSMSYGFATLQEADGDPHRALRIADSRMYANKHGKHNQTKSNLSSI